MLGWLWIAGVSAVTVALRVRPGTAWDGATVVLHAAGEALALGLVIIALQAGLTRLGRWRWLVGAGLGWLFAWGVLAADLSGLQRPLPAWFHLWLVTGLAALLGAGVVWLFTRLAARLHGKRWPALVGLGGGGWLAVVGALSYPGSYLGLHLLCLMTSGWLAGLALPAPPPRARRPITVAMLVWAAFALLRAPSNAQLLLLLGEPAAALSPYLAELRPALRGNHRIPEGQRAWFQDRSALPPVPPSPPLVKAPVVVMMGIDSFRADLMDDPRREADLPELFRLRRESTYFATARSPGASTAPAFTTVFSGKYYSQLYWRLRAGAGPDVYADLDPTVRFPQLLTEAGVSTATFDALGFLLNDLGVVRGFQEERTLRKGRPYAAGQEVMSAALARLERAPDGPLFLFLHLIDAHSPYTRAGQKATPFEGYVAELGIVDRELGRLRQALERPELRDRAILIVLSDHGEAFGEHASTWHGITLYDELLRVPLMIWTRNGPPRTVNEPVSLIDLGPTVLDLMGVATPARFMGQSLVPFLRGERPALTRPILDRKSVV